MIELPEALTIASQMASALAGSSVSKVVANHSPHKWAWFHGDPAGYHSLLTGRSVEGAAAFGSFVELSLAGATLLLAEGVNTRLYDAGTKLPPKHQLLLEFTDGRALVCSVQMYGGLWAFEPGQFDGNKYHQQARTKPSPLGPEFTCQYFESLLASFTKGSVKEFLATEQRIPGLGNGVLQDILFNARVNPRCKVSDLSGEQRLALYSSVRSTLAAMARQGGRDTEKDLFGNPGGYATIMCAKSNGAPCPACGTAITKQAYMGGSVYFCPQCQPVQGRG